MLKIGAVVLTASAGFNLLLAAAILVAVVCFGDGSIMVGLEELLKKSYRNG